MASSSAGLSGALTRAIQSAGRAIRHGVEVGNGISSVAVCLPRLDQRHFSARATRPARSGFRST
jgi:hypothetical protein